MYATALSGVLANMAGPSQNTGDAAGDRYSSIESLVGSSFNDTLVGNDSVNDIQGGTGNDTIQGRGGDDVLQGGEGNDQLEGGPGADTLAGGTGFDYARYVYATAAVTVDLSEAVPNTGDAAGDIIFEIEGVIGSQFDDVLQGDDANNDLAGLGGRDNIHGGAGSDTVQGGDGDDTLNGGEGADRLTGGAGNDTFIMARSEVNGDRIFDFNGNGAGAGDFLVFDGYGVPADGATLVQLDATHWRITSDDGGAVSEVFELVNGATLHPSDFTFI
jgi:Ca2+-binding RTX toxin-like protein